MDRLEDALKRVQEVVRSYRGGDLTEQDTKNAVIEPVLEALGWPKTDLSRVRSEYRQTGRDNPVDYALFAGSRPVLFVEAKALDRNVDDPKFVNQLLTYANSAGVDWAVITNGARWDLYKVFARTETTKKRLFSVEITDVGCPDWLRWLTPDRLEGAALEQFWRLVVAERAVRTSVAALFSERDQELVQLLVRRTGLEVAEVAQALQLLRPSFDGGDLQALTRAADRGAAPPERPLPPPRPPPSPPAEREVRAPEERPPADRPDRPTGSRPTRVVIGGTAVPVESWRQLLLAVSRRAAELQPARFDSVFTDQAFAGRSRRSFSRSEAELRSPAPVPGGFVETNQSADSARRLAERVAAHVGLEPSALRVELAEP